LSTISSVRRPSYRPPLNKTRRAADVACDRPILQALPLPRAASRSGRATVTLLSSPRCLRDTFRRRTRPNTASYASPRLIWVSETRSSSIGFRADPAPDASRTGVGPSDARRGPCRKSMIRGALPVQRVSQRRRLPAHRSAATRRLLAHRRTEETRGLSAHRAGATRRLPARRRTAALSAHRAAAIRRLSAHRAGATPRLPARRAATRRLPTRLITCVTVEPKGRLHILVRALRMNSTTIAEGIKQRRTLPNTSSCPPHGRTSPRKKAGRRAQRCGGRVSSGRCSGLHQRHSHVLSLRSELARRSGSGAPQAAC